MLLICAEMKAGYLALGLVVLGNGALLWRIGALVVLSVEQGPMFDDGGRCGEVVQSAT